MYKKILLPIFAATLALSLSACSGNNANNFFKSVDVNLSTQGADTWVNLTSAFDLGKAQLQPETVTVLDPKTQSPVGTASFGENASGQGTIAFSVKVSAFINASATLGDSLPNGGPLPLSLGVNPGDLTAIPILTNSRIYLGGDSATRITAGIALGIPGLDSAVSSISAPANLFFTIPFTANLIGVAGIYAAPVADETGIAVFGQYIIAGMKAADLTLLNQRQTADLADAANMDARTQRKLMRYFRRNHVIQFQ